MAGIYVHIPFCKKLCSYCDFYKSTLTPLIPDFLSVLEREAELRNSYLKGERVGTIYFGGGTPSLLKAGQIRKLIDVLHKYYDITSDCEVTIEVNPDDLSFDYLYELKAVAGINRLSIGIQSFNDHHLTFLNRRHNSAQALASIESARKAGFSNISIDLIYGIPHMTLEQWKANLKYALMADHLSAYHLTIEPGTGLWRLKNRGLLPSVSEEESVQQYNALSDFAEKEGFLHYEISNLAKKGFFSKHNSNYWQKSKYIGLGPSAHSYDLRSRQWNIANIKEYIHSVKIGQNFFEKENLTIAEQYNEYLMVSLRTIWGVNLEKIKADFGAGFEERFLKSVQSENVKDRIRRQGNEFTITREGWLVSDYILSQLMA